MRQKNEKFIDILNRICTYTQTSSDLAYLNKICMQTTPNDPTFPYLFYKNKNNATHNKNMLLAMPIEEMVINVVEEEEEC